MVLKIDTYEIPFSNNLASLFIDRWIDWQTHVLIRQIDWKKVSIHNDGLICYGIFIIDKYELNNISINICM